MGELIILGMSIVTGELYPKAHMLPQTSEPALRAVSRPTDLARIFPEWKLNAAFITMHLKRALDVDDNLSSHPVEVECPDANMVNQIFDGLSYSKAGSSALLLLGPPPLCSCRLSLSGRQRCACSLTMSARRSS